MSDGINALCNNYDYYKSNMDKMNIQFRNEYCWDVMDKKLNDLYNYILVSSKN